MSHASSDSSDSGASVASGVGSPRWVPVDLPKGDLSFPPAGTTLGDKWRRVLRGDIECDWAYSWEPGEMLKGMGIVLRRLDAVEAARRKDRLVLAEYVKECSRLKSQHLEVERMLNAAKENALYTAPAPTLESLGAPGLNEPRAMSLPELEWVQKALETTIKHNDPRLRQISHILQTSPTAEGELIIDFAAYSAHKQWQLYYLLRHKKVVRNVKMSTRAAATAAGLDPMHVSSLNVRSASAEELRGIVDDSSRADELQANAWYAMDEDEDTSWLEAGEVDGEVDGAGAP